MAEYYGFKKIYGFGILLSALMCFLSPIVAKWNVWGYMVLRGLQGVFTGVTFPSLYAMTARWVPLKERNSFIARSYFGTVFGKKTVVVVFFCIRPPPNMLHFLVDLLLFFRLQ